MCSNSIGLRVVVANRDFFIAAVLRVGMIEANAPIFIAEGIRFLLVGAMHVIARHPSFLQDQTYLSEQSREESQRIKA